MINIIIWIISLLIFSWCYSTLFMCIFNFSKSPSIKISFLIYIFILTILYLLSYYFLNNYFKSIFICSMISAILSLLTAKREK